MINVGFFYSVIPGKEEEFETTFKEVVKFLRTGHSGIKDAKLYRDVDQPGEFMIFTEWESVESFKDFTTSRPFKNTTEAGKQILKSHPRHIVLRAENI